MSRGGSAADDREEREALKRLEVAKIPADVFDADAFSPFKYLDCDPKELDHWLELVEDCVNVMVDRHHKGFNTATNNFTAILSTFTASQAHGVKVEESTAEARRLIDNRSQKRLQALSAESQKMQKALTIIDRVIGVARVPDLIKRYLQRRQHLHVVLLMSRTTYALFEDDLKDVGALKDIHDDLLTTRNRLIDDLLEDLHTQIYLKSLGARLKVRAPGGQTPESSLAMPATIISSANDTDEQGPGAAVQERSVLDIDLNWAAEDIDAGLRALLLQETQPDYLKQADGDTSRYITLLVHSLHRLQRLPSTRTVLMKRLRPALRDIIDQETAQMKKELSTQQRMQSSRMTSSWAHDTLAELANRVFLVFTRILSNHNAVFKLLTELDDVPIKADEYSISRVWLEMQNETYAMLLSYLQTRVPSMGHIASTIQLAAAAAPMRAPETPSAVSGTRLTFCFSDSNVASVTAMSRSGGEPDAATAAVAALPAAAPGASAALDDSWIPVLPDNILVLYRPVIQFTDQATSISGVAREQEGEVLRDHITNFVKTSFVPRVRADTNYRVNGIFTGSYAFTLREFVARADQHADAEPPGLMTSAFEIAEVIEHILLDYFQLPYEKTSLQDTVVGILSRVLEKYQEKVHEMASGTYAAGLVNDPNCIDILRHDPYYIRRRNPTDRKPDLTQADFFKEEVPIYFRLLSQLDRLDQGMLMLDPKQWALIAVIGESLTWLLARVAHLADPNKEAPSSSSPSLANQSVLQLPASIEVGFKQLADKCLFLLRVEFHCHSLYFLSAMVTSDYASKDETTEAEKFVVDLNKDLCLADERLSAVMANPRSALELIFGTQSLLVNLVLIRNASILQNRLINRNGLSRILRNIFALQQNMSNIAPKQSVNLDRARQYWELLKDSDLNAFIVAHPGLYSADEYQALKDLNAVFEQQRKKLSGKLHDRY